MNDNDSVANKILIILLAILVLWVIIATASPEAVSVINNIPAPTEVLRYP